MWLYLKSIKVLSTICFTLLLLKFAVSAFDFLQNDYVITFHRLEMTYYNKEYMPYVRVATYKYNRTQAAVNATAYFRFDFARNLEVVVQAYKWASNEFREFPIRFQFNLCEGLKKNHFGLRNLYDCGNFPRCPMKEGNYTINNWIPDQSKFPPLIPNGEFKVTHEVFYFSVQVITLEAYADVTRPIAIPK